MWWVREVELLLMFIDTKNMKVKVYLSVSCAHDVKKDGTF